MTVCYPSSQCTSCMKLIRSGSLTITKGGFVLAGSAPKYPADSHQEYHLHCGEKRNSVQLCVSDAMNYKYEIGRLASYDFSTALGLYCLAI